MIGPLVQGAMFIGVIYWYSKGMLTLINDYYRDEFKSYIEKDPKKDLILNPTGLSIQNEGSCTALPIQGLPDLLKSSKEFTRADGVVTRNSDNNADKLIMSSHCQDKLKLSGRANEKDKTKEKRKTLNELNEKSDSCASRQSLNSRKLDYLGRTSSNDVVERRDSSYSRDSIEKLILNPSATNKLSYKQITNQQVSDENHGKLTSRTSELFRSGNDFENVESINRRKLSRVESCRTMTSQESPRIAVNGVMIPQDVLQRKMVERHRNNCRRKSVNEMVQFWSKLEADATTSLPSPGKQERTFGTGVLNGDIRTPNS